MRHYKINILMILCLVFFLSSCKNGKLLSRSSDQQGYDSLQVLNMTSSQAVMAIQKKQPAYRRAHAKKMDISVDAFGRQMDVKATCKIVTDSAMHISIIPFFGVELFKIEMTPKSMIIIDKANRRFYESNYGIFYEKFGVNLNFHTIQSLISNRLFIPGDKVFSPDEFEWKNDTSRNVLVTRFDKLQEEVTVNFRLVRILEMFFKGENKSSFSMQTNYGEFRKFDDYLFPKNMRMVILTESQRSVLDFKIEEIEFNKPFEMKSADLLRLSRTDIRSFFR